MKTAIDSRRISIIGLGKLGAPFAVCLASRGYDVIAVDVNAEKVKRINEGMAPVFEPGLESLLQACRGRLRATGRYDEAIATTDITFILVPTPSDEQGAFSLRHVQEACEQIGKLLRAKSEFHTVVLTSTVLPGATENEVKPILERSSGKRCGERLGLCYSPEFVALGSVIHDLLNPDFILIGESDPYAGDAVVSVYKALCENDPPIARMNFVNAEITKLSVNTFVTTKITFANMLARICERLPGANVDVVTSALGLDSRIGRKYLKGAVAYGGPCFPRDNLALAVLGRTLGLPATLAEATDAANRQEVQTLGELVRALLPSNGRVGILGLTYKPNTDVVEASQGLLLARILLENSVPVVVYDPAGMKNAQARLGSSVTFAKSAEECIRSTDVLVLTTPWEEFSNLSAEAWQRPGARRTVIDCWRILNRSIYDGVVDYIPLGIGANVRDR
jgi:UDPglucose 6-dehydrogenase